MYFPVDYTFRPAGDIGLINEIAKAINGEYSAITCYEQLSRLATGEEERNRIMEIRSDEIRHYRTFSQIYMQLTGRQPKPQIVEPCPNEYRAGLAAAFKDEQETVDFYLDIAEQAANPHIKESFKRAAGDEQNHAVWFLYYLTQR